MIDETSYCFGLDGSRYWSTNGLANFKTLAQAQNPTVRFLAFRATISWGYVDNFFGYHWKEIPKIVDYRKTLMPNQPEDFYQPVGRMAYGVIYPGESPERQARHLLKTVEDVGVDWDHDRLVIDAELHHNQSRARITEAINAYGKVLKSETGRWPFLYMRYYWLTQYTNTNELYGFPLWYAQYLKPIPGFRYRAEHPVPPDPILADRDWVVMQTAERGRPQPYGVTGKQVVDYDRWNGDYKAVAKEFAFDDTNEPEPPEPPQTVEKRLTSLEERVDRLEKFHE